jgi:hypothetical protein
MQDPVPYKGAREVVTRSPTRSVGVVNAPCSQAHPIECESENERNFAVAAILNPWLIKLLHQPFSISFGRKEYTPDFAGKFLDETKAVIEVKMAHRVKEQRGLFNDTAALLREKGYVFYVVHNEQSNAEGRAERAEIIKRYAMHVVTLEKQNAVRDLLLDASGRALSIGQVMEKCKVSQWDLLHLVSIRVVSLDRYLHMSDDDLIHAVAEMPKNCAKNFGEWFGCSPWNDGSSKH